MSETMREPTPKLAEESAESGQESPALRITRRELIVTAGTVAAALAVAGCAPSVAHVVPTPTHTPFALRRTATLFADATVPTALAAATTARIGNAAGLSGVTAASTLASDTDFVLTFGAVPAGYAALPIGASPATALTHMRVPVDNITSDQMHALLSGQVTDWQAVGAPYSLGVHLFALDGVALPASVTAASGIRSIKGIAALLSQMRGQPGSLALVPVEAAEWRLRNLGIDGIYPAQGRGDATTAKITPFTLTLGVHQSLVKAGLDSKALAATLASVLAAATPVLDMAAVGDIMLGRTVNTKMVGYRDYLYPYRKMRDELQSADLRVANLECCVSDLAPIPSDPSTFYFATSTKAISGLTYAGFQMLTVANNHSNGFGPTPYLDMIANLQKNGIGTTGGGKNLDEARAPSLVTIKGVRVAMLGYDMIAPQGPYAAAGVAGLAPIDLDTLPDDIASARKQADLVIPYFHWGIEYTKDPTDVQQHIARSAIDAGADMVLGNHPHWIQGIETYKGKLIIYSMGNFIFDQDWSRQTLEGMLLHLYWRGTTLVSVRFVPVIDQDRCQPRIMSQAEAVDSFQRMWTGTDMLANGQYGPEPE
ncbi:MAG: Capsule biosynthesis protein capA [Ktedonobacterales bacterium]|jgi:poly-gamma-glutamate synthesis protein (capsule biosynthesis protein)|nr:MAG: Capsule biosynthesis protein capA [Ktedonobacterales bacterium]